MNREILFKGKQLKGSEWFIGDLSRVVHNDGRCYVFPADGYNSPEWYEVAPETVCQYTGLTDKYGVKIFEGDIIKTPFYKFSVCFKNGCLGGVVPRGSYIGFSDVMDCIYGTEGEVIGNIYDNPELLKQE